MYVGGWGGGGINGVGVVAKWSLNSLLPVLCTLHHFHGGFLFFACFQLHNVRPVSNVPKLIKLNLISGIGNPYACLLHFLRSFLILQTELNSTVINKLAFCLSVLGPSRQTVVLRCILQSATRICRSGLLHL